MRLLKFKVNLSLFSNVVIPGAKDSPFAYFFINVNKFGWNKVLVNVLVISAGYIAVGYLLYLLKKFIGRKPA